jgi:hypothetical protein
MWTDVSEEHITSEFCLATCCMLVSCSADFRPGRWRWYVPPKFRLTYGAMPQNMATFINTVVRTWNLTLPSEPTWRLQPCCIHGDHESCGIHFLTVWKHSTDRNWDTDGQRSKETRRKGSHSEYAEWKISFSKRLKPAELGSFFPFFLFLFLLFSSLYPFDLSPLRSSLLSSLYLFVLSPRL